MVDPFQAAGRVDGYDAKPNRLHLDWFRLRLDRTAAGCIINFQSVETKVGNHQRNILKYFELNHALSLTSTHTMNYLKTSRNQSYV